MNINITVSNYRCFSETPVRFSLKKGLQSFVGINNSGKSCLLRLFYELRGIFAVLSDHQYIWRAMSNPQPFNLALMVKDVNEMFCDRNERDIMVSFEIETIAGDGIPAPDRFDITVLRGTNSCSFSLYRQGSRIPTGSVIAQDDGRGLIIKQQNGTPIVGLNLVSELGSVLAKAVYLGPFRNAVNVGGSGDYYDIQIGQQFITNWRLLKTGYNKKQSEATYKLTEDIRRIFGFDSLEINASDDGQTLQLTINGRTYKQTEIGSGLIQFILVLVNAAIRNPSYILIDEPEINLHPSLQIDFLTTLASYAKEGVFFATHNLGLARAVSDRIYSVRRVGKEDREVRDFSGTPALAEFLGELGFNSYQDLGFETVLLVEGPTDVTCVQQLLRLYGKEHKIVLLQLGGSSLINSRCESQLVEVTRISRRVYALIDSERDRAGDALATERQGFTEICAKLGIPCHVLERRAIENYLPEYAIKSFKSDKYRPLGQYEKLKAADPAWGKEENWRIARLMSKADLAGTDLDKFLDTL